MNNVDFEAFELAKIYLRFYRKYTFKTFKATSVKNTKWWKFFLFTVKKYKNEKNWNKYVFIASQFYEFGKIFPYHLITKKAQETYNEYKHRFTRDYEKELALNLLSTFKIMNNWCKNNGEELCIGKFLKNNEWKIKRKMLQNDIFFVCRSAKKIIHEIYSKEEVDFRRAIIFSHKNPGKNHQICAE